MSVAEGLSHLEMECTDLARSREFYTATLGLRVTAEEPDAVTLETPGRQRLTLRQVPSLSVRALALSRAARGPHIAYHVEPSQWRALIQQLDAGGVPWADRDHATQRVPGEASAYVNDPDGYTVQLITTGLAE